MSMFEVDANARRSRMARDIAACRALLRENSKTFFAASLLLPGHVRAPASALYAFCRVADDAVDLDPHATREAKHAAVDRLAERLERVYAGCPRDHAPDRAFADVVAQFAIPRTLPEALLEGFRWDANLRRYATLEEVHEYGARVAGSVGVMMSLLMDTRDAAALARASDLGVAMQLSNIARDVGEDARAGRVYLPTDWLAEVGIDVDAWLANPVHSAPLGEVVTRLTRAASRLYGRVATGVAALPKGCQPGINAARFLYAEIGNEVDRAGGDAIMRRAVVPATVKARLLAKALVTSPVAGAVGHIPPLDECRHLIDACIAVPTPRAAGTFAPEWWNVEARVIWLVEFLQRLEQRDREAVARSA